MFRKPPGCSQSSLLPPASPFRVLSTESALREVSPWLQIRHRGTELPHGEALLRGAHVHDRPSPGCCARRRGQVPECRHQGTGLTSSFSPSPSPLRRSRDGGGYWPGDTQAPGELVLTDREGQLSAARKGRPLPRRAHPSCPLCSECPVSRPEPLPPWHGSFCSDGKLIGTPILVMWCGAPPNYCPLSLAIWDGVGRLQSASTP